MMLALPFDSASNLQQGIRFRSAARNGSKPPTDNNRRYRSGPFKDALDPDNEAGE